MSDLSAPVTPAATPAPAQDHAPLEITIHPASKPVAAPTGAPTGTPTHTSAAPVGLPQAAHESDSVAQDFLASRAVAAAGNPITDLDALLPPAARGAIGGGESAVPREAGAGSATSVQGGRETPDNLIDGVPLSGSSDITAPAGQRLLSGIGAVAKDAGLGVVEAPQEVAGGALDFVNNLTKFADDVTKKVEATGMPNVYFQLMDQNGKWDPRVMSTAEFRTAQAAGETDLFHVPVPDDPDSVTGSVIRAGTSFMLGRGNLAGAMAGKIGRIGSELTADFASGAGAGMDQKGGRLSNIVDQVAPNFLTDWLKAKPGEEDPLLGRLKSGLEGAGLGLAFEGIKKAVTALKGAMAEQGATIEDLAAAGGSRTAQATSGQPTQPAAATSGTAAAPGAPGSKSRDILGLGDPLAPAVSVARTPESDAMAAAFQAKRVGVLDDAKDGGVLLAGEEPAPIDTNAVRDYAEGRTDHNPIKLNLGRIGSGQDIADALAEVSKTIPEQAVQSNAATLRLADALGLQPGDLLQGYQGANLNAAQTTAMRMMLDSSAAQLLRFAEAARNPTTATPEAKALFLKAFATHRALQQYFENARAEAGRTLQSWAIMSAQRSDYAKAIGDLIGQSADALDDMAQKIADTGDALRAGRLVAASVKGTGRDTFLKVFYNVLLSNPRTIVKKLASDTGMALWNTATTYAAEKLGSGAVQPGEASQLLYGYVSSLKDAIRLAGKGLKTGESQFYRDYQSMDALKSTRLSLLANGAPEVIPLDAPTQAATSWLRTALPTRWIGAADDMAKYANYRAFVRQFAFRDGAAQGLTGADLSTYVAQRMENVPEALHQQALAETLRSTFQEPLTGIGKSLQDIADAWNVRIANTNFDVPVGRIILPFIKVPTNIARFAYGNSPLAVVFPSAAIRDQMRKPGAARDMLMARIGLGTAVSLGMADLGACLRISEGGRLSGCFGRLIPLDAALSL